MLKHLDANPLADWIWDHTQRWAPPLIIVGVLASAVLLAPRQSQRIQFFVIGVTVAMILRSSPPLGLMVVLLGGMLIPFAIDTGSQTSLNISILLVTLMTGLWLMDALAPGRARIIRSRAIYPLLALVVVSLLAFVAGLYPAHIFARTAPLTSQIGGLMLLVLSVAAFLLAAHYLPAPRDLQRLVWAFLGVSAVYVLYRLAPQLNEVVRIPFQPGAAHSLFWIWLVAISLSQAVFNRRLRIAWRVALFVLAVAAFGIGWLLGRSWMSGWFPPLVAGLAVLWLRSWRWGLSATIILVTYILWQEPSLPSTLIRGEDYSLYTRGAARDILMTQVFPLSPIVGLGPSNYYWYAPLFPILGYAVSFNSHNNYVDILLQYGALGMVCFTWFIGEISWLGWQLRRRLVDDFARAFVIGALGGLIGTLVASWLGDWFLPFAYNVGFEGFRSSVFGWLFLGALVALEQMHLRGEA